MCCNTPQRCLTRLSNCYEALFIPFWFDSVTLLIGMMSSAWLSDHYTWNSSKGMCASIEFRRQHYEALNFAVSLFLYIYIAGESGKCKRFYSKCHKSVFLKWKWFIYDAGCWLQKQIWHLATWAGMKTNEKWSMPWRTSTKSMWKRASLCLSVCTHWMWFMASITARVMCVFLVLLFSPPLHTFQYQCAEMSHQGHFTHVSIQLCQKDKVGKRDSGW